MRRNRFLQRFAMACLFSVGATQFDAAALSLESGPRKTHLLELFTSEGCSSCPPAEAWLDGLKDDARLWHEFVPVAFHVDYWDRLGWRDPFASRTWTARQYEYAGRWRRSSVYTPGFVLDGREWQPQNDGVPPPPAASEFPGTLKVTSSDEKAIAVSFQPATGDLKPLELHVARLGFGLVSKVKAGENRGRELRHDFVVLSLDTVRMTGGKAQVTLTDFATQQNAKSRTAIAAWVTEPGQIEPIQALGGWVR